MAKPILSTRTLTSLRRLAERAMQDAVSFSVPGVPVSNGRGGVEPGVPTVVAGLARYLDGAGDAKEPALGQLTLRQAQARLWWPLGASAIPEGAGVTAQGEVWHVVYAPEPDALSVFRLLGIKRGTP
jgi:hypothetical protein